MTKKLISVSEAKKLNIDEVQKLYKNYISKSQTNFFKNFSFGNDLIVKAEGSYLYTDKKKYSVTKRRDRTDGKTKV